MSDDKEQRIRELEAQLAALKAQQSNSDNDGLALINSGDLTTGDLTNVGEGAASVGGDVSGFVITGNNNHVAQIIQQMGAMPLTPEEMRREIGHYLSWVSDRTGTIELRGIKREGQQVVQLDLETVYVPLSANRGGGSRQVRLDEVLSLGNRLIITGGPGCGKTTVLTHIVWVLSQAIGRDDVVLAKQKLGLKQGDKEEKPLRLPIPIFVPLSAYAHYRRGLPVHTKPDEKTLAHFISRYVVEQQANFKLPPEFFIELLRQGQQVLLLLDGLDEVPNESERVMVRQAIEQLVDGREKEQLRVVVTCRTAAYQGRTALGRDFRALQVEPLAEVEAGQLVRQAYRAIHRGNSPLADSKAEELQESIAKLEAERRTRLGDKAKPLVTSPLLVRMLLVVHYSERRLPDQRAELYMKATDAMLLPEYGPDEAVAEQIGRLVGGSKERHRELVQYVAYEMHTNGDPQGREIDEHALKRLLQAQSSYALMVRDFIELTRLRGTLMEERLEMYRFIHLGFQEFLVARHLAETVRSDGGLPAVFKAMLQADRFLDSWWREPILLTVGYLAVQAPSQAERLVKYMVGIDPAVQDEWMKYPARWRWRLAELAATAVLEWPDVSAGLSEAVAQQLANLVRPDINIASLSAAVRIQVGQRLSQLGDPRPGVGVLPNGVPDIVWGSVVSTGAYTIVGDSKRDGEVRQVSIATEYRLAKYFITNAQFTSFVTASDVYDVKWWMGLPDEEKQFSNPQWAFANHPRESVSWYQAVAFCRWLSDKLEFEVRLPTEQEWEVAVRYGHEKMYPWGTDKFSKTKANTDVGGVGQTTAVGFYPTGRQPTLNLYDLSGNLWEWCLNKHTNPEDIVVDHSNERRVVRGGSWFRKLEKSFRYWGYPHYSYRYIGFRVICPVY